MPHPAHWSLLDPCLVLAAAVLDSPYGMFAQGHGSPGSPLPAAVISPDGVSPLVTKQEVDG